MSTPIAHHIAKPNKTPLIRARAGMQIVLGIEGCLSRERNIVTVCCSKCAASRRRKG